MDNEFDETVVEEFAAKLEPVYRLLNWKWRDTEIPDKGAIIKTLNHLYQSLLEDEARDGNQEACSWETGGLAVGREDGSLYVDFGMREYMLQRSNILDKCERCGAYNINAKTTVEYQGVSGVRVYVFCSPECAYLWTQGK